MTFTVFQVDPIESLIPYSSEIEAIEKLGGKLVLGKCSTEDDVLAQAPAA